MIGKIAYIKTGPFKGRSGEIVATSPNGRYFVKISSSVIISMDTEEFSMDEYVPAPEIDRLLKIWVIIASATLLGGLYLIFS